MPPGCRLLSKSREACQEPNNAPSPLDFSPRALNYTYTCGGMAQYDFFNLRFGAMGGPMESVGTAKDYMLMLPETSHTTNGSWHTFTFPMQGKIPKHSILPDPTYCCREPDALAMTQWPKKMDITTPDFRGCLLHRQGSLKVGPLTLHLCVQDLRAGLCSMKWRPATWMSGTPMQSVRPRAPSSCLSRLR